MRMTELSQKIRDKQQEIKSKGFEFLDAVNEHKVTEKYVDGFKKEVRLLQIELSKLEQIKLDAMLEQFMTINDSYQRVCSECAAIMTDGYCIYDGEEHYCSDECLHANYTSAEYEMMYKNDEAYYTEWEEEDA